MFHIGYEGAFQNAEKVNGPSYMNCDAEDKSNKCIWALILGTTFGLGRQSSRG